MGVSTRQSASLMFRDGMATGIWLGQADFWEKEKRAMKAGFVCSFGASTYFILKLVEKAARIRNVDISMEAIPVSELADRVKDFDVVLLGPQLKYKSAQVSAVAAQAGKKFAMIPSAIYGSMDGDQVLNFILELT